MGYKGTGIESMNLICTFSNAGLTALLTLEKFDEQTQPLTLNPHRDIHYIIEKNVKHEKMGILEESASESH